MEDLCELKDSDVQPAGSWLLRLGGNKGSTERCPSSGRRTILLPSVQDWPVSLPPGARCRSAGRSWKSSAAICRAPLTVRRAAQGAGLESGPRTFLFTGQTFENGQITLSSSKRTCGSQYCIKRAFPCSWT